MDDLGKAFEGLQRTAAVEFAPLITSITTSLTDMVASAGGGRDFFKGLADSAADFLINVLTVTEAISEIIADTAERIKGILDRLQAQDEKPHTSLLGKAYDALYGKGGTYNTAAEAILPGSTVNSPKTGSWSKGIESGYESVKDAIKKRRGELDDLMAGVGKGDKGGPNTELDTKTTALTKSLRDQVEAYGLAGGAAERFKLSRLGATDAQLAGIDASIRELTALQSLTEGSGRGLNIFQEQADKMAQLNNAMRNGIITADGFAAAQRKLNKELGKKMDAEALKVFQDIAPPLDKLRAGIDSMDQLFAAGKIDAQAVCGGSRQAVGGYRFQGRGSPPRGGDE